MRQWCSCFAMQQITLRDVLKFKNDITECSQTVHVVGLWLKNTNLFSEICNLE